MRGRPKRTRVVIKGRSLKHDNSRPPECMCPVEEDVTDFLKPCQFYKEPYIVHPLRRMSDASLQPRVPVLGQLNVIIEVSRWPRSTGCQGQKASKRSINIRDEGSTLTMKSSLH